jgi:hypothetical protein
MIIPALVYGFAVLGLLAVLALACYVLPGLFSWAVIKLWRREDVRASRKRAKFLSR